MQQSDNTIDKSRALVLKLIELTVSEANILDAATHIRFGELCSVDVKKEDPCVARRVSPAQEAFITVLRDQELSFLDTIVVHNGLPSQIELRGTFHTIEYIKKVRFN